MTDQQEFSNSGRRLLSRRTVVRTAAHSAWMVPAISLATAAPALAASGGTRPSLAISAGSGSWGTVNHITGNVYTFTDFSVSNIVVSNPSTNPAGSTAAGITVTVDFSGSTYKPTSKLTPSVTGSGWSYVPGSSTATSYVFSYSSTVAVNNQTNALGATFSFTTGQGGKPSGESVGTTAAATVSGQSTAFLPASGSISSNN